MSEVWRPMTGPWSPVSLLAVSLGMVLTAATPTQGCGTETDADGDGYSVEEGDCNDGDSAVYPGAIEVCGDGVDSDCDGSDQACATAIHFTQPTTYQVTNPVTFAVTASSDVKSVSYVVDGQYAIGSSSTASSGFSITYSFTNGGVRQVEAQAKSSTGEILATDSIDVLVEVPNEVQTVCYLGKNRDYSVCYELDPMTNPPPTGYEYSASCEASYGDSYRAPDQLLDLLTVNASDYLAPNFQLSELAQSSKGQYAVIQSHAVDSLQAVRDRVGVLIVNSGYRSPAYNADLDGSATCSRHTYGDAFDLDPSSVSLDTLASACVAEGAGYYQLYETHVHCDWRDDALDDAYYRTANGDRTGMPQVSAQLLRQGPVWTAPAAGFDEGEPLRQWEALDELGTVLAESTGRTFTPPAGAHQVRVRVGGQVEVFSPIQ